jgi:hypothetical protein
MADKIALVVHFHMEESAKQEFVAKRRDIFANTMNEETFVEASLVQDIRDPPQAGFLRAITIICGSRES